MRAGVVVAGGRSRRFGERDKALADLAGAPMIRRVADRLDPVVGTLVVNCRRDQREAIERALSGYSPSVRYALDPTPGEGPTAGVRTGLGAVDAEYAFVCACDMPFVDERVVRLLAERAAGRDAAVPRLDDGHYQPTHAVYRAAAMADACDRALARGERSVRAALADLDGVVVTEAAIRARGSVETFTNCNTRAEFERAAARFEG